MTGLTVWVKKNKGFTLGIGIVLLLMTALCLVLFTDLGRIIKNEPKIITSNVEIKGEYEKVSDIGDLELRDNILDVVNSGRSGYYEFGERKFVILTTGGPSASDIEYKAESNTNGETNITWKLSDTAESDMVVRYKVIEVTGKANISFETRNVEIKKDTITGIATMLLFEDGSQKKLFNARNGKSEVTDVKLTPGIYTLSFKDGEITDYEACSNMEIEGCTIVSKVIGGTYSVRIPSGELLNISIDNLNLKAGSDVTLTLGYSNGFNGTLK